MRSRPIPYIAQDDPDLAPDVRKFEPGMALISGRTGFEAIDTLIREAPTHLEPEGWLVLEHGWKQAEGSVSGLCVKASFT